MRRTPARDDRDEQAAEGMPDENDVVVIVDPGDHDIGVVIPCGVDPRATILELPAPTTNGRAGHRGSARRSSRYVRSNRNGSLSA